MASVHEGWIADLFADLTKKERDGLMALLARTKTSVRKALGRHTP
jgi:hypothetical protein